MATKLFSPSLTRRSEPPNSMATVMHVGTETCMVNFRGKSFTAKMIGGSWKQGDTAYFIECPRGKYWITREQGSWYANKIENWIKAGLRANATLEYFLRKCRKHMAFMISDTGDLLKTPSTTPTDGFGSDASFNRIDTNGDGKISLAELLAAGGTKGMFDKLDTDGDGFISMEEWKKGKQDGSTKIRKYATMIGQGSTGGDNGEDNGDNGGDDGGGDNGGDAFTPEFPGDNQPVTIPESEVGDVPSGWESWLASGRVVIQSDAQIAVMGHGTSQIINQWREPTTGSTDGISTITGVWTDQTFGLIGAETITQFAPIGTVITLRPFVVAGSVIGNWDGESYPDFSYVAKPYYPFPLANYTIKMWFGTKKYGWKIILGGLIPSKDMGTSSDGYITYHHFRGFYCGKSEANIG